MSNDVDDIKKYLDTIRDAHLSVQKGTILTESSLSDKFGSHDVDEMEMLKEEIREMVEQLYEMVSDSEKSRAKAYWYPQILMALDNDHEWLGSAGESVQDTIDAMREEDDDDGGFDDAVTRGYEDSGKYNRYGEPKGSLGPNDGKNN